MLDSAKRTGVVAMTRRNLLAAIVIAICFLTSAWAQQRGIEMPAGPVYIRGVVRDAVTHQPIYYARVLLESEKGGGYAQEATTDSQGKFEFQNLAHVVYLVRVKLPGYKGTAQMTNACDPAGCRRVDLSLAAMDYVDFSLVPLPGEAPAVPPGGPGAVINVGEAQIPEAARKEFDKGVELTKTGQSLADSIAHFKKAIEVYPAYQQAYVKMGTAYMDLQKWSEAENALNKAVSLNEKDPVAYLALGTVFAQQKNFEAAEKPLARSLELQPDVAETHCELSRTYWALKKYPQSDQHAQRCAALKPEYAPGHLMLGNLAMAKRDHPGALREYREYLRLDPQGSFAAPVREQVSRLEKELGEAVAK